MDLMKGRGVVAVGSKPWGPAPGGPPAPTGLGTAGYGDYARERGYGAVGFGGKGWGNYARSRGYAKLGN